MLTRIEIDGFKTFRDFALDVPPFLAILGRNASGKSNLFDAVQFLRLATQGALLESTTDMRGDMVELFHQHVCAASRMKRLPRTAPTACCLTSSRTLLRSSRGCAICGCWMTTCVVNAMLRSLCAVRRPTPPAWRRTEPCARWRYLLRCTTREMLV
jgi:uncharacterized protein DUF2813